MSDDKYITVPVRVPADLEVQSYDNLRTHKRLENRDGVGVDYPTHDGVTWYYSVHQQIAAAVEAHKPTTPLFQVGDVVEWEHYLDDDNTRPRAGLITWVGEQDGVTVYKINDLPNLLGEFMFKLVRRAEK